MFNKKVKEEEIVQGEPQTIELNKDDVALVLRADGKCETICTLKGKHSLSPQEELIIGLGGLLQNEKFCNSVREHFLTTMQKMINQKYVADASDD
jgi:hypothetical protein